MPCSNARKISRTAVAIFEALNRLEAAGIVKRAQRLVRRVINFGGMARLSTVQSTSLYAFFEPSPTAPLLPVRKRRKSGVERVLAALFKSFSATESAFRPGNPLKN